MYITYIPAAGADAVTKKLGSCFTIGRVYAQGGGNGYAYAHLTLNVEDASKIMLGGHFINNEASFPYAWLVIKIDNETIIDARGNTNNNKNAMINALKATYDVSSASSFYIQFRTTSTDDYMFGVNSITIE